MGGRGFTINLREFYLQHNHNMKTKATDKPVTKRLAINIEVIIPSDSEGEASGAVSTKVRVDSKQIIYTGVWWRISCSILRRLKGG